MPNASTAVCTMRPAVEVADGVVVGYRLAAERLDLLAHLHRGVVVGAAAVERDADVVDDDLAPSRPKQSANSRPIPRPEPGDDRDAPVEQSHRSASDGRGRRARDRLVAVLVGDGEVQIDEVLAALFALAGDDGGAREHVAGPHLLGETNLEPADRLGTEPVLDDRAASPIDSMPWPNTEGLPTCAAMVSSWCIGLKSPDAPA